MGLPVVFMKDKDIMNKTGATNSSLEDTDKHTVQSPCTPFLRKRKLTLEPGSQTGTLTKHTTTMKNSPQLRKRLNQTYFVGGKDNKTVSLETTTSQPSSEGTPKRSLKRVVRRLNSTNKQQLITSSFTPKSWKVEENVGIAMKLV